MRPPTTPRLVALATLLGAVTLLPGQNDAQRAEFALHQECNFAVVRDSIGRFRAADRAVSEAGCCCVGRDG